MGDFVDTIIRFLSNPNNQDRLLRMVTQHVYLALLPVVFGIVFAIGLGWIGTRVPGLRTPTVMVGNLLYTVPSLALFVILPGIIGTRILNPINVVIALTIYSTALLVRPVIDALGSVPGDVLASATAMGYRPVRRFFAVELPLAVPVLTAGTRVASASNISMVSVGALIGVGGLGVLFTDGYSRGFPGEIVIGIVLTLLLALTVDFLLVLLRWWFTPWQRAGRSSPAGGEQV